MTLEDIRTSKRNVVNEFDENVSKLVNQYDKKLSELTDWYCNEYNKLNKVKNDTLTGLIAKEDALLEKQETEKEKELEKVRKAYEDYEALRNKYNETYGTEVDSTDFIVNLFRDFL